MFGNTLIAVFAIVVVLMILNIILSKVSSPNSYTIYMPGFIIFGIGLILFVVSSIAGKVVIVGLSLGAWGIACLFAVAISLVATAIVESKTDS
ncbi:hypothetical protein ACFO3D_05320 [Virgibacillus kekensis]|uniref:YesK-like protein n=1 Tax=Virgibacillus kekensis TaxID=202261 RepID=A0ABV9DFQ4_9BACI